MLHLPLGIYEAVLYASPRHCFILISLCQYADHMDITLVPTVFFVHVLCLLQCLARRRRVRKLTFAFVENYIWPFVSFHKTLFLRLLYILQGTQAVNLTQRSMSPLLKTARTSQLSWEMDNNPS